MKVFTRPKQVEAIQWHKQGDHPRVERARWVKHHCEVCGKTMNEHHGLLTNPATTFDEEEVVATVCPGDWIVELSPGKFARYSPAAFEEQFTQDRAHDKLRDTEDYPRNHLTNTRFSSVATASATAS